MSPRPYRMGARTVAVAETRTRVLEAARDAFVDVGYHRASLEHIAKTADVARATVYHQFHTKLGLLDAVVVDFEERAGLPGLTQLITTAPVDGLITSVMRAGCQYWATDPSLVRVISAVAVSDNDARHLLADHDAGRLRLVSVMVRRLRAADRLRPGCSARRATDTLWLLTSFNAYDELARGREMSWQAVGRLLTGLAEQQLRGSD